jgi:hypothetical protein
MRALNWTLRNKDRRTTRMTPDAKVPMAGFGAKVQTIFDWIPVRVSYHVVWGFFGGAIFSNARSNALPLSSTPALRAASTKRANCSGLSGLRLRAVFGVARRGAVAFMPHYLALR